MQRVIWRCLTKHESSDFLQLCHRKTVPVFLIFYDHSIGSIGRIKNQTRFQHVTASFWSRCVTVSFWASGGSWRKKDRRSVIQNTSKFNKKCWFQKHLETPLNTDMNFQFQNRNKCSLFEHWNGSPLPKTHKLSSEKGPRKFGEVGRSLWLFAKKAWFLRVLVSAPIWVCNGLTASFWMCNG